MSGKPYERLNLDNSALSYADLHHETTRSVENSPLKSYGNRQKQGNCRRESNEDELIRYMSNLPGYLEKGESTDEKVLNVGVLDWACLEQWQYSHQHMPHISSRSSISNSNTSLSVSKDISSGCSSKGGSLSPSCQRICHPSLQSHFMAFGMQGHSRDAKSSLKCIEKCQTLRGSHSNTNIHSQFVWANGSLSQNLPDSKLKSCNREDLNPRIDMKRAVLSNEKMYEATLCTKSKKSPQEGERERRVETSQPSNMDTVEQDVLRKNKPLVFRLPRDIPQDGHSGVSDMRTSQGRKSRVPFQVNGCSSIDAESIKVPTATFSASLSAKMRISPCRSRTTETKQTTPTISSAKGTLGLNQKVASEKPRSSSPFRRFSFSTGFTSKGSGCKEDALLPHRSSVGTSSGNMRGCSSSDISGNGKAGDFGRNRSSPLRRLLDPLLKPKAVNGRHSAVSSQNNSLLINKKCMSATGKSSTLQLEKELITNHGVGCSTVCTDSSKNEKHKSSTVQALLNIAVKNGLPLYTFAIDKNSNILAATVKKLETSEKDDCSCIYTFFTFREVNKKNGNWMKQAGKCKGTDYIHHVVAQMEVSNSHFFYLTGQNYVDSSTVKEFVLYSVKLNQGGDQATDYQPNDELAAIILKIPKTTSFINDVHQSSSCNDGQEFVRATVVLPSGIHSHPSKGGPSSLIERWKSGGSCDCGGWDMGCELKILANENLAAKKSSSSKAHAEDHFELYFQGNGREHMPALSFVPFEHGIFSVVYDSSLSLLQAFSISIALVDGKMPRELSGPRNSVEGKPPRVQIDGIKAFSNLGNTPASYAS